MSLLSFHEVSLDGATRPRVVELSLTIESGECVFLLGPNGAGKSSVLRLALALERPSRGVVQLGDVDNSKLRAAGRAAQVAWLPQQQSFEQALTAREVVAMGRHRFHEARQLSEAKAEQWLERVGALGLAPRRVTELSGGEQQRVKLAALLAQQTPLLLLDEPANHLDPAQQLEVYRLLAQQWQEGRTVLCVTHDINLLSVLGQPDRMRVIGLLEGRVAFDTNYADPELAGKLEQLFGIPFQEVRTQGGAGGAGRRVWLPTTASASGRSEGA